MLVRGLVLCFSVGLSVTFCAVALEFLSRSGLISSYAAKIAVTTPDDHLMVRLKPHAYAEINARGYRNPSVPTSANVVALGDSQTYGYNAAWDEAWPMVYGELTGRSVYNMGIGSYGPAQYLSLLDEALALEPETLLFGFYLGNDLLDACAVFQSLEYWRSFALEHELDVRDCVEELPPAVPLPTGFQLGSALINLELYRRIKEIPLVTALISRRRDVEIARTRPDDYFAVAEPGLGTVVNLTRLEAMTDAFPPTRRGAELTEFFYQAILDAAPGVEVGVVFIPTKASAMYDELLARGVRLPPAYHELVQAETERIRHFARFFSEHRVRTVDSTPRMRSTVALGEPVFKAFADGHPRPSGYRAIAESAAEAFPGPMQQPR